MQVTLIVHLYSDDKLILGGKHYDNSYFYITSSLFN